MKYKTLFYLLALTVSKMAAQIPTDIPHPENNTPVDFSKPEDVVIYIILPIAAIILYIIWRKKKKNANKL